jgi:sortase (surface protein transpeptidase)
VTLGLRGASFRGRAPLLLAGAGVVLVTAAGLVACQSRPAPDVGGSAVSALASAVPSPQSEKTSKPSAQPAEEGPATLRIPAIEVDAAVGPVGVDDATGDIEVPDEVDRLGWYRFGPGMNTDKGSIVVTGHVDSAAQGKGAFFKLEKLSPGDKVTVTGTDGGTRTFEVIARERYAKTKIPLARYFARDGAARLTLITCGGPFDATTRHYRDNIVVTAKPLT